MNTMQMDATNFVDGLLRVLFPTAPPEVCPNAADTVIQTITEWAKNSLDFHPDPYQTQILTETRDRLLILGPRQTGKSTAAAIRALYEAIHHNNAVILLASASGRQSGQIMEKARAMARSLNHKILPPPNKCDGFRLANGAGIIALPDNDAKIRGFSAPRLIIVDEAAFASPEIFTALDPMLSVSGGTIMLLSTPNGQTGYFYEQWHAEKSPWVKIQSKLEDCPRINPETIERIRQTMSKEDFEQEFECKFVAAGGQFISRETFRKCLRNDFEPFFPEQGNEANKEKQMGQYPITHYYLGFDLGRDRDHSAIAVLSLRREDHGDFDRVHMTQPTRPVLNLISLQRIPLGTEYLDVIKVLRQTVTGLHSASGWGTPSVRIYVVLDAAGPGQIAVELIRAEQLEITLVPTLLTAGHEAGRSTSGKVTIPRRELVSNFRYLLEAQLVRVQSDVEYVTDLEREVAAVRPHGGQSEHDDLVIAASLAAWQASRVHTELVRPRRVA